MTMIWRNNDDEDWENIRFKITKIKRQRLFNNTTFGKSEITAKVIYGDTKIYCKESENNLIINVDDFNLNNKDKIRELMLEKYNSIIAQKKIEETRVKEGDII